MTYASDRLNKEVIRPMRGRLVKILKASELVPHLYCLTDTDREEILAKQLTDGNHSAVMMLLDNLVRRENWVECFIEALRLCEHPTVAEEIQDAYDRIRGTRQTTASSAPVRGASAPVCGAAATAAPESPQLPAPPRTAAPLPPVQTELTVTTASPQNIPPVSPFPLTPSEAPAQSAAPARIKSPLPNITVQVEDPIVVLAPESPVLPDPKPAHTADPQLSGIAPHVRPNSPVSAPKVSSSPDRNEQSVSSTATPEATLDAVSPNTVTTPFAQFNSPCTTSQVPAALEESRTPVAVEGLKHPVQDTHPVSKLPVLARNSQNNARIHQLAASSSSPVPNFQNQATPSGAAQVSPSGAAQVSPSGAVPGQIRRVAADPEECFSKPGVLEADESLSITNSDLQISRITAFTSPVQRDTSASCSITTADLMISRSTTEPVSENAMEISKPGASSYLNSGSPSRNTTSFLREPVEDHYESGTQGLQPELGIITNTGRISEMPSVQDLHSPNVAGNSVHTNSLSQSLRSEAQPIERNQEMLRNNFVASGQARPASDFSARETGNSGQVNAPESDNGEESQGMLRRLQSDPRFLVAAAVCVTAIFMAWKHK